MAHENEKKEVKKTSKINGTERDNYFFFFF